MRKEWIVGAVLAVATGCVAAEGDEAKRIEAILARHQVVLNDVYTNVAAPYKAKGRTATGSHIGNGDAI